MLLMGAGGTGKSAVVHELDAKLKDMGTNLLVTAYTGVASAPFGGPTLLALFNLSPSTMKHKRPKDLNRHQIEDTRKKFKEESGMDMDCVGSIVIDEISFVEAWVLGHVDSILRQCTGTDAPFGGIPMLLAGDNMQKEPPNSQGGPWYKCLVDRAIGDLSKFPTDTAQAKGLDLLADMPLYKLERLMRAQNDQKFVEWQKHMRRTDVDQPVCNDFLDHLRELRPEDLKQDMGWAFAPIGVLSRWERGTMNYSQARTFAENFAPPS